MFGGLFSLRFGEGGRWSETAAAWLTFRGVAVGVKLSSIHEAVFPGSGTQLFIPRDVAKEQAAFFL